MQFTNANDNQCNYTGRYRYNRQFSFTGRYSDVYSERFIDFLLFSTIVLDLHRNVSFPSSCSHNEVVLQGIGVSELDCQKVAMM